MQARRKISLPVAPKLAPFASPARYKICYGGRGGAKSWGIARLLVARALASKCRVLCARELQVSMADSVHRLLCDQIAEIGAEYAFDITKTAITAKPTGSEFVFKGLRHNAQEIKSMEGIDICWVEEAANVSKASWDLLIPTIRKEGSEIWISFNPGAPDSETYQRFVVHPPVDAQVIKIGWQDNPWFPAALEQERAYCEQNDPDAYAHIWGGEPRVISEAQIFKGKFVVEPFETPDFTQFFYGADWGFANDPSTVVRCFVKENRLYIEYEAWAQGLELDQLPDLFDTIPGTRELDSEILADASRPEIIKHLRNQGYPIRGAKKWPGSVEEGISVMRSFEKIVIHPRCRHTIDEFNLYSYKTDPTTEEIMPVVLDKNNHCIDAIRYALDWVIRGKA